VSTSRSRMRLASEKEMVLPWKTLLGTSSHLTHGSLSRTGSPDLKRSTASMPPSIPFPADLATQALRKILASDDTDGTGVMRNSFIFSWTLIGPRSTPGRSNAARTPIACCVVSSGSCDGLVFARRIRGPLNYGETDTRINRLNAGHPSNIGHNCQDQTPRSVRDVLTQNCQGCPETDITTRRYNPSTGKPTALTEIRKALRRSTDGTSTPPRANAAIGCPHPAHNPGAGYVIQNRRIWF